MSRATKTPARSFFFTLLLAAPLVVTLPAFLAVLLPATPAVAFWPPEGVAVCVAPGNQYPVAMVPDERGGAFLAWLDEAGGGDVHAQWLDAAGELRWGPGGVAVCTQAGLQLSPMLVADGAGGAIVTWYDARSGNTDVYAQRVDAAGAVRWAAGGVAICTAAGSQEHPRITTDGVHGAIVTWQDRRSGAWDIFAQRINASGTVLWAPNGVPLCTARQDQTNPYSVADGMGGAIVVWRDYRSNDAHLIHAQRVDGMGLVRWMTDGIALATVGDQVNAAIAADGAGGALVAWQALPGAAADIYAQRIDVSGRFLWAAEGAPCCSAPGIQSRPRVVADGAGGAVVAWVDVRAGNSDVYAQRMDAAGAVLWGEGGVSVCADPSAQGDPAIAADGAGGAVVTWYDSRSGSGRVYAQRVTSAGGVAWVADGVAIWSGAGVQLYPAIAADGAGGAILSWLDTRNGDGDVYAQVVDAGGRCAFLGPSIAGVRDVPGDEGGQVSLSWRSARLDLFGDGGVSYYSLWRALDPALARALPAGEAARPGGATGLPGDPAASGAAADGPSVRRQQVQGRTFYWQLVGKVEALHRAAYGAPMATLYDSTAACGGYTYFQVVAHAPDPAVFWESAPDSGCSLDNRAPRPPAFLAAYRTEEGTWLRWQPNSEPDLALYRLYRGSHAAFAPGPESLLAEAAGLAYLDGSAPTSPWYKLVSVDTHGNESAPATLSPAEIIGGPGDEVPLATRLIGARPNPFNSATTIVFSLQDRGRARLAVYDASGRLVRTLLDEQRPAGQHAVLWDGTDDSGRAAASGVYFCRMEAESYQRTSRMALVK